MPIDLEDVRFLAGELPTLRFTSEVSARQHGENMAKLLNRLCDEIEDLRNPTIRPFGRVAPDDELGQRMIEAWNSGVQRRTGEQTSD